jgi:hypothetical protein
MGMPSRPTPRGKETGIIKEQRIFRPEEPEGGRQGWQKELHESRKRPPE